MHKIIIIVNFITEKKHMQQGSIKYVGRKNQRKQKYVDYPSTLGESNEVIELTGGGT